MQLASRVARHLGWEQITIPTDWSRSSRWSQAHIQIDQLATSFQMETWQTGEALQNGPSPVFTGLMGDSVVGGSHISWGYDSERQEYTFETLFRAINRHGFSPEAIRKLIRPEALGDHLEESLEEMGATFDALPGQPFQRVWQFDLLHRQRLHVAPFARVVAFGSWPALPFVAPGVVEAAAGMPAETLLHRRAESEMVCRRFPDLAALPLDRNTYYTAPLRATTRLHTLYYRTFGRARSRLTREWNQRLGRERRYYFRVFDFNNPGWRAVRQEAEQSRRKAETVLQPEALRDFLPPPDATLPLEDAIVDGARFKALLGFLLWAGKYL